MKLGLRSALVLTMGLPSVVTLGLLWTTGRIGVSPRQDFVSPNGKFTLRLLRRSLVWAFPGQGNDAPGFLHLVENQNGELLRTGSVDMVQLVEHVEWSSNRLYVKFFANWSLPDETR